MDLVTQRHLSKEFGQTVVSSIDHGPNEKAIILTNAQGHYLGDWHSSDVELVRQMIILFKACLHWFENNLHTNLISLFAKEDLSIQDLSSFNASIFDIRIKDCEPAQDFNEKQQNYLNDFFAKVLGVEKGFEGTFRDLNQALAQLSITGMLHFEKEVEALPSSNIFNEKGLLKETRPQIFNYLQELIKHLDEAIFEVRNYVERLDIVLNIKYKVLGLPYTYITLRSEIDEIRQKMQTNDFLTVVIYEQDGSLFPVGVVRARDLHEQGLGTVSLRDFCNLEEVRMASYLEVISVVDHHKSSLKTLSVPTALIGDAQSCNVLIAEQMFLLNDKYSLGGMSLEKIEKQIQEVSSHSMTPSQMRILQRLLQRRLIAHQKHPYYVHPRREFTEYFCFLQAILDDTDLLTKVSHRDLACVIQLLNRLKSLSLEREVEIIDFDDLPQDKNFIQSAAQRILQQADMYSLYTQIYSLRESEVEANLSACMQGRPSNIFLDAKEQNGCARVGQTKIFASNFTFFYQHVQEIRQIWLNQSLEFFNENPEIDLYIHMISTIASAEEVYKNQIGPYHHQDELWFWTPPTQHGYRHLNSFLAGFQHAVKDFKNSMSLEFLDSLSQEFIEIFSYHFPEIPKKSSPQQVSPIAVLRFKAGALNSRKSMVTPYLPRLV
jgi:virulence-associated protein VapD